MNFKGVIAIGATIQRGKWNFPQNLWFWGRITLDHDRIGKPMVTMTFSLSIEKLKKWDSGRKASMKQANDAMWLHWELSKSSNILCNWPLNEMPSSLSIGIIGGGNGGTGRAGKWDGLAEGSLTLS